MTDLNAIADFQAALRDNMIAPVLFAAAADLRLKASSFLKGGEIATLVAAYNGHKTYVYAPSVTTADDGVTVLKPYDLASTDAGRWVMVGAPMLQCAGTYDPANLVDGAGATTTLACVGAALGDAVLPSFSLDLQGILLTAWVSAADVVSFRFQNETGGAIDLASGTLRALVTK